MKAQGNILESIWMGNIIATSVCPWKRAPLQQFFPQVLSRVREEYKPYIYIYQDDIVIAHEDVRKVKEIRDAVLIVLQKFGTMINQEKSFLVPQQYMDILGYKVSFQNVQVEITRIDKLVEQIKHYIKLESRILGRLTFLSLMNPKIQQILQPAYIYLNRMVEWTSVLPIHNMEIQAWREAVYVNRHGAKGIEATNCLFTDATDKDGGASYDNKKYFFKDICKGAK